MFGQYLSHTNKRVTVAILQKISQVNKALEYVLAMGNMWRVIFF